MTRRLGADCLSDLELDRWLAGELTARERSAAEAHRAGCASCRARCAQLSETRRDFVRAAPPFAALGRPSPAEPVGSGRSSAAAPERRAGAGRRARWLVGGAALAAAAALALVVGAPWSASEERRLETRTKGGVASFGWLVRRGERVLEGRPDQPLRAGDALRFSVSAREPVFVAILGRDARTTSVYHPDGELLARVEAGSGVLLPAAIELDATPDAEQLIAVFCRSPVPVARVRDAVERSLDAPALPEGCSSQRRTLLKEPP